MSNNNTPSSARTTVDGGALAMALNVLRRAGKVEVADALESSAVRGSPDAANAGEPATQHVEGFLCRAWGETDLPAAALCRDMTAVRQFLIDEWLGDESSPDWEGKPILPGVMDELASYRWADEGNVWKTDFEIGGISVERVTFPASLATPTGVAADESRGQPTLREDAMYAMGYQRGAKDGWNFCISDDQEGFARTQASTEHVRVLRDTRAADESPREPDGMRAAFMAWVESQGCDTDGAWSAWQGCWNLLAAPPSGERPSAAPVSSIDHAQRVGHLPGPEHWQEVCRTYRCRMNSHDINQMAKLRTYIEEGLLVVVRPTGASGERPSAPAPVCAHGDYKLCDECKPFGKCADFEPAPEGEQR